MATSVQPARFVSLRSALDTAYHAYSQANEELQQALLTMADHPNPDELVAIERKQQAVNNALLRYSELKAAHLAAMITPTVAFHPPGG